MIEDCGGQYQIFKYTGQNQAQVTEFFEEANAPIQKKMERILKENEEEILKEN